MKINNQWHPKARVKIRRCRMIDMGEVALAAETYKVFEKGLKGKRTTWLYKSDITLEQAIEDYCDFKPLLDKYPSFDCGEDQVFDQFDRIVVLHHYLNKLKIAPSKVEDAIKAGDISLCTA